MIKHLRQLKRYFEECQRKAVYSFLHKRLVVRRFYRFVVDNKLKPLSFPFFSFVYFLLVAILLMVFGKYVGSDFVTKHGVTFFLAIGSTLVTSLAIFSSFIVFQIQHASQQMSAGFFEVVIGRGWYKRMIAIGGFAFISLLLPVFWGGQELVGVWRFVFVAYLFVLSVVFWLFAFSLRDVLNKVNPIENIRIIERDSVQLLEQIQKEATAIARVLESDPKNTEDVKRMAGPASYIMLSGLSDELNAKLRYLYDYHDKLRSQNEVTLSRKPLAIIRKILRLYIKNKEHISVPYPQAGSPLAVVSDSKNFLAPNLERLLFQGGRYVCKGDNQGVRQIVGIFESLLIESLGVSLVNKYHLQNPLFNQVAHYFNQLVNLFLEEENFEGLYQSLCVYGRIGKGVIEQGGDDKLSLISQKILDIAQSRAGENNILLDGARANLVEFIIGVIQSEKINWQISIKMLLKNIRDVEVFSALQRSVAMNTSPLFFRRFTDSLLEVIEEAENKKNNGWKRRVVGVLDEFKMVLRYVADKFDSTKLSVNKEISYVISSVGCNLIEMAHTDFWSEEKGELLDLVNLYIHIPGFFIANSEQIDDSAIKLADAIAKIGITATKKEEYDLAKESINAIIHIASYTIHKDGSEYGFLEPRVMQRACHVGLFLQNADEDGLVTDYLRQLVVGFNKEYCNKWITDGMPGSMVVKTENQLKSELLDVRDDIRARDSRTMLNRSNEWVVQEIDLVVFDQFFLNVWGVLPEDSALSDGLNFEDLPDWKQRELKKEKLLKSMIGILKNMIPPDDIQ